jgi:O-antigen/teichoic acid export membrane protein
VIDLLRHARVRRLSGAVSGQMSQALVSFVLQLVAAHALGAAGLGRFSLLYSAMIAITALCNGLVGDSLMVLDRHRPEVRSALQSWCLISAIGTGLVTALLYRWDGLVGWNTMLWFFLANVTFLVESVLRMHLMAVMRFWSLVIVDVASLVASLVVLLVWRSVEPLTLDALLAALVVGQVMGICVVAALLPANERWLAPRRPAAMRQVASFGVWRALQQSIRPIMLTLGRLIVVVAVGQAMFGQLEAGRVYMSPALLVVQGLGSYLFSSYARDRDDPWRALVARADRSSAAMLSLTLVIGVIGTLLVPYLGHLVTGPSFSMVPVAVFGWAVYAASSAAVMPYASLVSVRGNQRLVVSLRTADSVLSLALLAVVMLPGNASASWAPYLLAVGSFVDGAAIRWFVLRRRVREERRSPERGGWTGHPASTVES